ncbi:MAG: DUF1385 domain-containing protein [Candidatus Saganbacteria bacterium]|nr:DUF1385 domain-containing protein [Candidatus Saganbacteria bacterium]
MPELKLPEVGGQAVIEGVMMKGPAAYAISVRKTDGTIETKVVPHIAWTKRHFLLGLPFVRGVVILAESMVIGIRSLNFSANLSLEAEGEKISKGEFAFSFLISILFSIGLFIALPAFFFNALRSSPLPVICLNLIEGSIRIFIFVGFLLVLSCFKDLHRVFEYHGAEHKTIYLFHEVKDKDKLNVADAQIHSTLHASCGTSFLLIVLVVSILVFSFLGRPTWIMRIFLKLSLMPVVAGISYEIIRIARRDNAPLWARILVTPGKWLQLITTKQPSNDQVEVAIEALKHVV